LHTELTAGANALHAIYQSVVGGITLCLNKEGEKNEGYFGLFEWIKHEVGLITANAA
jgi:hypothetical protein